MKVELPQQSYKSCPIMIIGIISIDNDQNSQQVKQSCYVGQPQKMVPLGRWGYLCLQTF